MIEYKKAKVIEIPTKKVCDKCGRTATDKGNEVYEWQEFHHIHFVGGYGSVFGDEIVVQCDICQHCLYEMIKDFCRME
jgi:hypothetical protein